MDPSMSWAVARGTRRARLHAPMHPIFERQLLVVAGKGGVGKTTVAAALALAVRANGKRVLLAQCQAEDRIGPLFGEAPLGPAITTLLPGLDAVNMDPGEALREYGRMVLRVETLYKAVFENRYVEPFLRGTPGMDAWAMLGKAYFHAQETGEDGERRYDLVVLDAPATGHALTMLRVPQVIVEVAPPGLLRREAERALDMLRNPARGGVLLVTLPEEMPVTETLELASALEHELLMPPAALVINGVLPPRLGSASLPFLEGLLATTKGPEPTLPLLQAALRRAHREAIQQRQIERIRCQLELPTVQLPHLFVPEMGREHLVHLAGQLAF